MQIKDLYRCFYETVRNYPSTTGQTCKQPQAFAVLQDLSQINATNLEKDRRYINTPYYFSRVGADKNKQNPSANTFVLPMVVLIEENTSFIEDYAKTTFNFFILDKMPPKENNAQSNLCEKRTVEEIFEDLRVMWNNIFASVLTFADVSFNIGADSFSGFYPLKWAKQNATSNFQELGDYVQTNLDWIEPIDIQPLANVFTGAYAGFGGRVKFMFDNCGTPIEDWNFAPIGQVNDANAGKQ